MASRYDVVVAGGSIAGFSFAAEAAKRGLAVLVLEEHQEIGEPEKCDGLVSLRGLRIFAHAPSSETIQSRVRRGVVHAPGGGNIEVDSSRLDVVVLDRSAYDKEVADEAMNWGARMKTGARVEEMVEEEESVRVRADETYQSSYFVDATGPASSPREGILPAAKFEIEAGWIEEGRVEVFLDQEKYPGFFAWIIPYSDRRAKVGAAGRGINSFKALEGFLGEKPYRIERRTAAPIYVGGQRDRFVEGRKIFVGESAGQVKPTTAGGITTSVAAGVIAARWTADSIRLNEPALLQNYEKDWLSRYGSEFSKMLKLRRFFESTSNRDLDRVIEAVSSPKLLKRLSSSDFDFHATGLLSAIGITGLLKLTRAVASTELKRLVSRLA